MQADPSEALRRRTVLGIFLPNWAVYCLPALAITVLFFSLVRDFGPGYDELIGDFQYGERSLFFLGTGDWRYLQFEGPPPLEILHRGHSDLRSPYLGYNDHGHAAALVSAATCLLFFRTLEWLPAVEAHHAGNWLFAAVLATVLFRAVRRVLGLGAAAGALLFLLAQPRVLAHFFFNIKDFPEACLFGLCVLSFWTGWTGRRARWILLSALVAGAAFVVKANILFLPAVLVPWAWYHRKYLAPPSSDPRTTKRMLWALGLMPLAALIGFYATWPFLWTDPVGAAWRYVDFVWGRAHSTSPSAGFAALGAWLFSTPEIILAGLFLGIVFWVRETDKQARSFLALSALWLAVPLVRANLPGMQHHDGIRLFLEVTVPTAVFAGWGIDRTLRRLLEVLANLPRLANRRGIIAGVLGLSVLVIAVWEPVRVYPYELAYFNRVSGGLAGAQSRGDHDATDYWAASYRQGIAWLNANVAEKGALAVPFAEHLVRYTRGAPSGLRSDLRLLAISVPTDGGRVRQTVYFEALKKGSVTVMFVTRKSWYNEVIRHAQEHGRLAHAIRVDGVPILEIHHVPATRE